MTRPPGPAAGPGARQWRWVAHPPGRPPGPQVRPPVPRHRLGPAWLDPTPRYAYVPRWGLPPVTLTTGAVAARRPRDGWAHRAPRLLTAALVWLLGAGVVHLARYGMLAAYADRVVPRGLEICAVVLVWAVGAVALAVGTLAAIASAQWLVAARRTAYAPAADPRGRGAQLAACLVPPVCLAAPAVLLRELDAASHHGGPPLRRRIRRWWAAWLLDWTLVAVTYWRATADGQQAAADSVLMAALAYLAAAWVAAETRGVMRSSTDSPPEFTRRLLLRGTVDTERTADAPAEADR